MSQKITIGLCMHQGRERTRRTLDGVLQYVGEHDLTVRNLNFARSDPELWGVTELFGMADGIVADLGRTPGGKVLPRRGVVPVVNAASDLCHEVVSVFVDAAHVARLAVEHFLKRGFRNFAFVGYRLCDGSLDRAQAFAKELKKHGFALKSCQTETLFTGIYTDFASLDEVEPKLVRLIQKAKKPLAMLAMSDGWAATACRIAAQLGLAMPDDVAVLGIGDSDIARISSPAISSIRTPIERIGYEAARLVHKLIRDKRPARRNVKVPAVELIPRESTMGKRRAMATDVGRALEYIRQNACQGIRIEDVANHVNMSLRTFEIQFAAAVGRPVGEEIRSERIKRAKNLLETTELPLETVAHQVGFNAASNLNDFFRRWTDTTPIRYRRGHKRRRS